MERSDARKYPLHHVDESRRAFLKKLILGSSFVIPTVATFSMSGLAAQKADAQVGNGRFYSQPGLPGQENCYGQTISYLEHINEGQFNYFMELLTTGLEPHGLAPAHGIAALAGQWCKYGVPP